MFNTKLLLILLSILISKIAFAECKDFDAKQASNDAAEKYVKGKVFRAPMVLKRHLPSKHKEVASYVYVKNADLYYTIYTIVNLECEAHVLKRTNGKH